MSKEKFEVSAEFRNPFWVEHLIIVLLVFCCLAISLFTYQDVRTIKARCVPPTLEAME